VGTSSKELSLLEVFRIFEIRGIDRSVLSTIIRDLTKSLPHGWRRNRVHERENAHRVSGGQQFVFHVAEKTERPPAEVFLALRGSVLEITNIVPEHIGELTRGQYNEVLLEFKNICTPVADWDCRLMSHQTNRTLATL
jgi:hypothetical protein